MLPARGKGVLHNRVRQFRELYGYSQKELAARAGVPESSIRRLEGTKWGGVSMAVIEPLCLVFGRVALERMVWIEYTPQAAVS